MQQCFRKLNLISDQYQHAETHPSPLQRSLYKWCREGFRCIKCSVCALETFSNLIQVTSAKPSELNRNMYIKLIDIKCLS